jgi:lipoprotein NlpI
VKRFLHPLACGLVLFGIAASLAVTSVRAQDAKAEEKKAGEMPDAEKLIGEAVDAVRAGKTERALELAGQAISKEPNNPKGFLLRARIYSSSRRAKEALPDFDKVIAFLPKSPDLYEERGSEHFKVGNIKESIADFDKEVALDPKREPSRWKRGISYYYAGKYAEGRKQFEGYQNFDSNDVENAVWRFLCMARESGVGFDKARADILKIGDDRRVPMRQVYDLFAGKAQPEDVLAAASAPTAVGAGHERLFYAHQYLALYYEAKGDAASAQSHMQKAVEKQIGHYMWDVAKVHVDLRKPEEKP